MARSAKTKQEKLAVIHENAVSEFSTIVSAQMDERKQCLSDRRFYSIAGAQWEGALGKQFDNKPKFEVNKIHLSVIRIINEYRNNRVSVSFIPKDGTENDKLADACSGLFRADEQDSGAEEAYDNAFEEAVGGGFGAFRLRAEYEDEYDDENDKQRIRIEPIYDADTCVFFDTTAKKQDKSDATRCFVLTAYSHSQFEEEWGEDPTEWARPDDEQEFDWVTDDSVFVAEYYKVEVKLEKIYIYKSLDGDETRYSETEFNIDETLEDTLIATGSKLVNTRKVKRRRVRKFLLSGNTVLEDCGYIAGNNIPVIPMYGKRWVVDNIERCMGHVRLARDVQMLKNMQLSKLGEIASVSSVSKPIVSPEQMQGYSNMWANDAIENYPFLYLNPLTDADGNTIASGPLAYTQPAQIPPALAALLQITESDMQDLLGNQQDGEKMISNISGDAIELIQGKLDMQTFIYMSNFSKAMKRCGEVWLSMARDILVEPGRKMKTVGDQKDIDFIELSRPVKNKDGETEYENDMQSANLDVSVDVGPSSSSKRQATVKSIMGMMQITGDPETKNVLGAMAMLNMEGEGITEVRGFFRKKLVNMGVIEPTKEEEEEMARARANQKPDANEQYLEAAAEKERAATKGELADVTLTLAKAEETQAKTAKMIADVDREDREEIMKTVQAMQNTGTARP